MLHSMKQENIGTHSNALAGIEIYPGAEFPRSNGNFLIQSRVRPLQNTMDLCILLSAYFQDAGPLYVVHNVNSSDNGEFFRPNVSRMCGSAKTLIFLTDCAHRELMELRAPVISLLSVPTHGTERFNELLVYCFPWINIMCRVPMHGPSIVSRDDLECCDLFHLDSARIEENSVEQFDVFAGFERIQKDRGVLDWYAVKSQTVCSRCGWTKGEKTGELSKDVGNATLHLLIHPYKVYTRQPQTSKVRLSDTSGNFGDLEGFERALVKHLAGKYAFKLMETRLRRGQVLGFRPDSDPHALNKSIISRLLTRKFHMIYGDITLEATRLQYGDFSYSPDMDFMSAASKITENKRSFASLGDGSCILWHVCFSLALASCLSRLREHDVGSVIINNFMSIVFRPIHPYGALEALRPGYFNGKFLSTVHSLCALVIACALSGLTRAILSKKTLSGFFRTETDVQNALSSPDAVTLLSIYTFDFFKNSPGNFMKTILEKHTPCTEAISDCLDVCLNNRAKTCLSFGEAFALTDALRSRKAYHKMYICPNLGFNILKGFLFNKDCFLNRILSKDVRRAAEQHLIARFKINAGLDTHVRHRESTEGFKKVSMGTFEDVAVFYWWTWALAVFTLIIENAFYKLRNFRGPPQSSRN